MLQEDSHPLSGEEERLVTAMQSQLPQDDLAPYLDHRLSQNSLIHLQDDILNLLVGHAEGTQKDGCQKMKYKDIFLSVSSCFQPILHTYAVPFS